MSEISGMVTAVTAGFVLGAFFFGGLWWTVNKSISARHVALLFLGSMLVRSGIVMFGFYYLLADSWQHLLTGLLGFVAARLIVTRLTRPRPQPLSVRQNGSHAS